MLLHSAVHSAKTTFLCRRCTHRFVACVRSQTTPEQPRRGSDTIRYMRALSTQARNGCRGPPRTHVSPRAIAQLATPPATLLVVLPWWLQAGVFIACLLFASVLLALLPVLQKIYVSAATVERCTQTINSACAAIQYLTSDLRDATESVSKPLKALSSSAESLPFKEMWDDPDSKLLRTVAGATSSAATRNLRTRAARLADTLSNAAARIATKLDASKDESVDE